MALVLGCIADDFTGATDLANTLVLEGMRTIQVIGVPDGPAPEGVDAIVVALKSRTEPVAKAVADSRAALAWLRQSGATRFFFKYCSTFDSTKQGNIGPVAEALLADLGDSFTIACPAFPENERTVYQGHLFVGHQLLSDSPLRHHPLTPMTDGNLVRFLRHQTEGEVGLVPYRTVEHGASAIRSEFEALRQQGIRVAIVDAITEWHLRSIGEAGADLPLITGGSGVALGLPDAYRDAGLLEVGLIADDLPSIAGLSAVVSGSCSPATLGQIEVFERSRPVFRVDPFDLAKGRDMAAEALTWAEGKLEDGPVLVAASAPPDTVAAVQQELGREAAGAMVEQALAAVARGLVGLGVRRLVVAGGETSGAVVETLGIRGLRIGPQIDPGVPATVTLPGTGGAPELALALKSGNFGKPEFFQKAFKVMP